jgi:phosphopantothenoylcysteine decarboxylase / phosphopantothenate---cysteine ligase
VQSADDMHRAVLEKIADCSIAIFAAAVADYRPVEANQHKIKRTNDSMTISLEPTPDILAGVTQNKGDRFIVGFAAETENVAENARKKLAAKNADLIVANDVTAEGAGFDHDTNIVTLIVRDGRDLALPRMSKREVAQRILDEVVRLRSKSRTVQSSAV